MPEGVGPKLYSGWSDGILLVGVPRTRSKYELRIVDALSGLLSDAGSIPAASTISVSRDDGRSGFANKRTPRALRPPLTFRLVQDRKLGDPAQQAGPRAC